jgi:hypothetical protein
MLTAFRKYEALANATIVLLLLSASMCLGQSRRGDVIANVPFRFMVSGHALPPGRYIVTPIGERNLRICGNKQSVIFQTHSASGEAPDGTGKVVFHRYGGTYFLSEVWVPATSTGRQLFRSQAEKELARSTNREVAVLRARQE